MDALKAKGLNGFQLKLIALILMVLDHIHEFFSYTGMVPIWFKWLGRIVAPIFMFLVVEGYIHTRNKFKYMLKLYIGSVVMGIGSVLTSTLIPRPDGFEIQNNIFSTFLMIVVYMMILDFFRKAKQEQNSRNKIISIVMLAVPFIIGLMVVSIIDITGFKILGSIIPNIITVEGGPVFVILGIVFYLTRDDLRKLVQSYSIFSLSILVGSILESGFSRELFVRDYQWMMIFSIFFFYAYNGKKGRGLKYMFYVFYPLHIFVLYTLSYFLMTRGV